jgi:hypothetical protein
MEDKDRAEAQRGRWVLAYLILGDAGAVCRRFGISRPTLRKWLRRYEQEGKAGSPRAKSSPASYARAEGRRDAGAPDCRVASRTTAWGKAVTERTTPLARAAPFGSNNPQGAYTARSQYPGGPQAWSPQAEALRPSSARRSSADGHMQDSAWPPVHGDRRLQPIPSPSYSVRPNGAVHQWREDPPGELSVDPGS